MEAEERQDSAEPYRLTVRWGECDPFRIVFYPNYFVWFDEATWHRFAAAGLPRDALERRFAFAGFPLVKAGVEFHAPCRAGDRLAIGSDVVRWGRSSFELRHRVTKEDGRLAAEGRETRVWTVSREDGIGSDRVPDEIVARLGTAADRRRRGAHGRRDDRTRARSRSIAADLAEAERQTLLQLLGRIAAPGVNPDFPTSK